SLLLREAVAMSTDSMPVVQPRAPRSPRARASLFAAMAVIGSNVVPIGPRRYVRKSPVRARPRLLQDALRFRAIEKRARKGRRRLLDAQLGGWGGRVDG